MLQNQKVFQSSIKIHPPRPPPTPPLIQNIPTSPSSPIIEQCCKLSRRELAIFGNSSLLLLLSSQALEPFNVSRAGAEENLLDQDTNIIDQQEENNASNNAEGDLPGADKNEEINASNAAEEGLPDANKNDEQRKNTSNGPNCSDKAPTKRAFLDISIGGEPAGRIIIGLYGKDAPAGATRFGNLVSGAAGISYRRKEFIKIMPNYVQHGGVRSYGVDAELAQRRGTSLAAESLVDEGEREYEDCPGIKNLAGTVSIIVRDPSKPPPKLKLVAKQGKLEIDREEVGIDPNGTEFVISTKDSPELDASSLVVGRVLEGMEVVEKIAQVKTVQENTRSPYFRVAKLIGDKRAVVAERGFNRPYSKVVVTNCGLMG